MGKKRSDTFVPNKKRMNTNRYKDLHKYAQASLGAGANLKEAFETPPECGDRREWLAIMCDNFTNEAMILLQTIAIDKGICTPDTCPNMTAGPNYQFLWQGPDKKAPPENVPAIDYCANTIDWVLDLLDDETFFPQDDAGAFPKDFEKKIKKVFQRLIRVYAHWYRSHVEDFEKVGALAHLNTCFRHLYFFCVGNKLVEAGSKDWEPVKTEIEVIVTG